MNFLSFLGDIISGTWIIGRKVLTRYLVIPAAGMFVVTWVLIILNISTMILFWTIPSNSGVIIWGIIGGLLLLLDFNTGKLFARIVFIITVRIFKLKNIGNHIAGELVDIVKPALFVALANAFLAVIASIKGVTNYSIWTLLLWVSVIFFFYVFSYYSAKKTLVAQYIMATIVVVLLLMHVLIPVQSRAAVSFVERITIYVSNKLNLTDRYGDLVKVSKGTLLFNKEMQKVGEAPEDINAKIVNTIEDDGSGEDVYELIFPQAKGIYIGGQTFYVPTRVVEKIEVPKDIEEMNQDTKQVNQTQPRVFEEWVEFPANGEVSIPIDMEVGDLVEYCSPTAPFQTLGKYQWHTITDYTPHQCTGKNPGTIKGCGKRGKVLVRVTRGYYL